MEEGEEEAERPEQVEYPQMEDYPQMDDYPPDMGGQEDFGAPGYTEFEVPIKGNETTFLEGQVMEEEDDVEVGRRGSEVSRKSSVTPVSTSRRPYLDKHNISGGVTDIFFAFVLIVGGARTTKRILDWTRTG